MLFTVCGPQVGPLVNTLIYFKLVKYPTLFKEPWSQDLVVCLAGPDLITYFQLRFTLDFATPKILFGNSSSNFWSCKIEQKSTLKFFKGSGPGQWVSKALLLVVAAPTSKKLKLTTKNKYFINKNGLIWLKRAVCCWDRTQNVPLTELPS